MAIGLLIAGIVLLAIVAAVIALVLCRRRKKLTSEESRSDPTTTFDSLAPASSEFENPMEDAEGAHELDIGFDNLDISGNDNAVADSEDPVRGE
jgi:hypothetical protein